MFHQTESKFQGWRALAIFEDGAEFLLYLGRSSTQIRAGYAAAFTDLLDDVERARVKRISMQCWAGAADQGRWIQKNILAIPAGQPTAGTKSLDEPNPMILPFQPQLVATA
jgi:hypothetical protein